MIELILLIVLLYLLFRGGIDIGFLLIILIVLLLLFGFGTR